MRLAMLSFRLPRAGYKRGGVERVAHDLADGLARRGHDVTVWSADPAPPGAVYQVRAIPGRALIDSWLGFRLVSGYIGNVLALFADYGDAQAIIAHGDSILLPLLSVPTIRVMHGSAWDEARTARSAFRKILQAGVFVQEHLTVRLQPTVAISRSTRERYSRVHQVISNGVDTRRFYPDLSRKSGHPSLVFVGTLGGRKRGKLLLDWFTNSVRVRVPEAQLWMVSEPGPEIPGVTYFSGACDETLARLYRKAWVYASPSTYEGFGLPYLEAMASGTPVIATSNPGSREVLDEGRYGRLIESDEDFAPAIIELLSDQPLRNHWIDCGLERARQLSLSRTLDQYEALLAGICVGTSVAEAHT